MGRQRVTITLKNDLLKILDSTVDGEKIRNRSHAVEFLLAQSLLHRPVRVLILAGGKKVTFSRTLNEVPKALLPINGKPLLERTIERLRAGNLTDIVISLDQAGQRIRDYFRNGSRFGVNISYIIQQPGNRGTTGPLKQAQAEMNAGTFLLIYGDVLSDIDYSDLLKYHRSQVGTVATMALTSVEHVSMWGVARLIGSRIVAFEEKPKNPKTHSHLVNAGAYVMEPSIFKYLDLDAAKLEAGVLPRLAEEGKLGGYTFDGLWYDVSTPQAYEQVLKEL